MPPIRGSLVTLLDGREVDTYSRDWLLETGERDTQARAVIRMATKQIRRDHLHKFESRYGAEARRRLEKTIKDLWALGVR